MSPDVPITFRNEQLLLAHIMRFCDQVKPLVFGYLTPDKFIYDRQAKWGADHKVIYRAMERVMADGQQPSLAAVVTELGSDGEGMRPYLSSLLTRLSEHFKVNTFDEEYIKDLVEKVDKAGFVYQIMAHGQSVSRSLETQDEFDRALAKIESPDQWAANVMARFSQVNRATINEGYIPVSKIVEETREMLERQRAGLQQFVLPTGLPSLYRASLWRPGTLTVVHGASSSGKSLFVHTADLGVALGLMRNGLKGCVAINSIEMMRSKPVLRWISMLSGLPYRTLTERVAQLKGEDYERLQKWLDFIAKLPIAIDDSHFLQFDEMKRMVVTLHTSDKGPVRQLSVDYLELFNDDGDSEELRLSRIIRQLQNLAHEYDIHVVAISQTTYPAGTKVTVAGPNATRYSRSIQHAADVIIELFNPQALADASIEYQLPAGMDHDHIWAVIEKNRDGEVGKRMSFRWQPECFRVLDPLLNNGLGQKNPVLFEHLTSVQEIKKAAPSAQVVDVKDTSLGEVA